SGDRHLSAGLMSAEPTSRPGMDDTLIPEFVDAWPDGEQLPILYMRAARGASGVISDGGNAQYDLEQIKPYLRAGIDGLSGEGDWSSDADEVDGRAKANA